LRRWFLIFPLACYDFLERKEIVEIFDFENVLGQIEKIELSLLKAVVKRSGFWMLIMTEISVFGDAEHWEGIVPMTSNWNIWRHLQLPSERKWESSGHGGDGGCRW
jgi:hypothetical protein